MSRSWKDPKSRSLPHSINTFTKPFFSPVCIYVRQIRQNTLYLKVFGTSVPTLAFPAWQVEKHQHLTLFKEKTMGLYLFGHCDDDCGCQEVNGPDSSLMIGKRLCLFRLWQISSFTKELVLRRVWVEASQPFAPSNLCIPNNYEFQHLSVTKNHVKNNPVMGFSRLHQPCHSAGLSIT